MSCEKVTTCLLLLLHVSLSTFQSHVCPSGFESTPHDTFGSRNYVQEGIWHRVNCPAIRDEDVLIGCFWYKGKQTQPSALLLKRSGGKTICQRKPCRYSLPSCFSLVIQGVTLADEGSYLCRFLPRDSSERNATVDIKVIAGMFPVRTDVSNTAKSLTLGRRQGLDCQCAVKKIWVETSVVYWSTGEGVMSETEIIAARLSDTTTVQFRYGADFSINTNFSLMINSFGAINKTQRFWCHAFQTDHTLRSCYTDVNVSETHTFPVGQALQASERVFYILEDTRQVIPCTSWTPGDKVCDISWRKSGATGLHHLTYSSSNDHIDADDNSELSSDFGLILKSVGSDRSGSYHCSKGPGSSSNETIVHVIGQTFVIVGGRVQASYIADREDRELRCLALENVTTTSILIWSNGSTNASQTSVIGTMSSPNGNKNMSEWAVNSCLDIASSGSLLLNDSFLSEGSRYWCHVFPHGAFVIRSFVDVTTSGSTRQPTDETLTGRPTSNTTADVSVVVPTVPANKNWVAGVIVAGVIVAGVIVAGVISVICWKCYKKSQQQTTAEGQSSQGVNRVDLEMQLMPNPDTATDQDRESQEECGDSPAEHNSSL